MKNEVMNMRLDGVTMAHNASVKIDQTGTGKDDPSYTLAIKVDFTGWTVEQILGLAMRTLVISAQRVWRTMTPEALKAMNGKTILASDMGKKPREAVDYKALFMAEFKNASPERKAEMLAELEAM